MAREHPAIVTPFAQTAGPHGPQAANAPALSPSRNLLERVSAAVRQQLPTIESAYLVGSVAQGHGTPESDLDVVAVSPLADDLQRLIPLTDIVGAVVDITYTERAWVIAMTNATRQIASRPDSFGAQARSTAFHPPNTRLYTRLATGLPLPGFADQRPDLGVSTDALARALAIQHFERFEAWFLIGSLANLCADETTEREAIRGASENLIEAVAAARGVLVWGPKWLWRKCELLGCDDSPLLAAALFEGTRATAWDAVTAMTTFVLGAEILHCSFRIEARGMEPVRLGDRTVVADPVNRCLHWLSDARTSGWARRISDGTEETIRSLSADDARAILDVLAGCAFQVQSSLSRVTALDSLKAAVL